MRASRKADGPPVLREGRTPGEHTKSLVSQSYSLTSSGAFSATLVNYLSKQVGDRGLKERHGTVMGRLVSVGILAR